MHGRKKVSDCGNIYTFVKLMDICFAFKIGKMNTHRVVKSAFHRIATVVKAV